MAVSTVTVLVPADTVAIPNNVVRPAVTYSWAGGTGPFDATVIWDDDPTFGNANGVRQIVNETSITSPFTSAPTADLGNLTDGHTWYLSVTVTDTFDSGSASDTDNDFTYFDPKLVNRHLYFQANVGFGFTPTDDPPGGWGEGIGGTIGPDGLTRDSDRHLYFQANVTTDQPCPWLFGVDKPTVEENESVVVTGVGLVSASFPTADAWDAELRMYETQSHAASYTVLTITSWTQGAEDTITATVPFGTTSGFLSVVHTTTPSCSGSNFIPLAVTVAPPINTNSLTFEAWTLPHLGAMTKVAAPLAVEQGSYQRVLNGVGGGRFTLRADDPDIAQICDPPNNVQTIIRVVEDQRVVYSFFARNLQREYDPEQLVTISGPGIENALDQVLVYPYDWKSGGLVGGTTPASESTGVSLFPDTIYGGDNILDNPSFDAAKSNETQQLWHDYRHDTTLNGAINDTQTNVVVVDGSGFPTSNFRIKIGSEWLWISSRTGNTLTVLYRGYAGTTATSHSNGARVDGGGRFTLTFDGQTTWQLDWDATPAEIESALILLTNVIDVDVQGVGTQGDPWLVEFIDPGNQNLSMMTFTNVSLTSGTTFQILEYWTGGKGTASPWTKSQNPNNQQEHGGYDVFSPGSFSQFGDPAHSGDSSLGIDPNANGPDTYPGAQQIVPVTPAGIYQAAGWFYPITSPVECALVVRDLNENLIAKETLVCQPGVWTQMTISNVVIPAGVDQVIFRAATLQNTTINFWLDDFELTEGMSKASAGQIIQDLWTAANTIQGRNVLTWLKHDSFSNTLDSDNAVWDKTDLSVILSVGMTWLQALDVLVGLGYEWKVDWNPTAQQYELKLWNSQGAGFNRTGSNFPAIRANRVERASALHTEPQANTYLGEGSSSLVKQQQNGPLAAAYGRREGFLRNEDSTDLATLEKAILERLSDASLLRTAVKATLDERVRIGPGLELEIGDVVKTYLPPLVNTEINTRVVAASVMLTESGEIIRQVDVDRQVFRENIGGTTSSATSQAVNWLLRRFRRHERAVKVSAGLLNLIPTATDSLGGPPYILVAAYNARDDVKAVADYLCDGVDDQVEINAALQEAKLSPNYTTQVVLSDGEFVINEWSTDASWKVYYGIQVPYGVSLRGMGEYPTFIQFDLWRHYDPNPPYELIIPTTYPMALIHKVQASGVISDMYTACYDPIDYTVAQADGTKMCNLYVGGGWETIVERVYFDVVGYGGVGLYLKYGASAHDVTVRDCHFDGTNVPIYTDYANGVRMRGILHAGGGGTKIEDSVFTNFAHAIDVFNDLQDGTGDGHEIAHITGCYFWYPQEYGIKFTNVTPWQLKILNNRFIQAGAGWGVDRPDIGCCIDVSGGWGGFIIAHNTLHQSNQTAIYLRENTTTNTAITDVLVTDNTLYETEMHGIVLDHADKCVVSNNLIKTMWGNSPNTDDYGIWIKSGSDRNFIHHNYIEPWQPDNRSTVVHNGIRLETGVVDNIVVGNYLTPVTKTDPYTNRIVDNGTTTKLTYPGGAIGDNFS